MSLRASHAPRPVGRTPDPTCPCQSDVLTRMMCSGSWSSETRMWFSWSYTVFLGICGHGASRDMGRSHRGGGGRGGPAHAPEWLPVPGRARRWTTTVRPKALRGPPRPRGWAAQGQGGAGAADSVLSGPSPDPVGPRPGRPGSCPPASPPGPTCSWLRVSGQRSLSRLLARSFCGRAGCRSFSDVLRPRRPACLPSDLRAQDRLGQGVPGWPVLLMGSWARATRSPRPRRT